jgi:hypothetical protein
MVESFEIDRSVSDQTEICAQYRWQSLNDLTA